MRARCPFFFFFWLPTPPAVLPQARDNAMVHAARVERRRGWQMRRGSVERRGCVGRVPRHDCRRPRCCLRECTAAVPLNRVEQAWVRCGSVGRGR